MKRKFLALLLTVLMVVALVPASVFTAMAANEIVWLTHGVDDCFDVYNGTTLVNSYKTLPEADGALQDGYTIKLKGNIKGVNLTSAISALSKDRYYWGQCASPAREAATSAFTWTLDGCGYMMVVEVEAANTNSDRWAWSFCDFSKYDRITWKDMTLLSNAGGVIVGGGANANGSLTMNNVKVYAGYSYHYVDPTVYPSLYADFQMPSEPGYSNTYVNTAAGGQYIKMQTAMGFNSTTFPATLNNCTLVTNSGTINVSGPVTFNGCEMQAYYPNSYNNNTSFYDGTVLYLNNANANVTLNDCRITADYAVNETLVGGTGWDQLAQNAVRLGANGGKVTINSGVYKATGNVVHIHNGATTANAFVTINGGTFIATDKADVNKEYAYFVRTNNGNVTINGGTFVNQRDTTIAVAAVYEGNVQFNAGTVISKADVNDNLDALVGKMTGKDKQVLAETLKPLNKADAATVTYDNASYKVYYGFYEEQDAIINKLQGGFTLDKFGKDLTTGTRADALVYNENACFAVYDGETLIGNTYKTWAEAWTAMKDGYTLKLLGNIHAENMSAVTITPAVGDSTASTNYTIDGQGFVFDVEFAGAHSADWQYPLVLAVAKYANVTINNFAMLSDVGCIRLSSDSGNVTMNNVSLYGSDGYFVVDPEYYGEGFVRRSVLCNYDASATTDGYRMQAAFTTRGGNKQVTLNGNSVFYGRNAAVTTAGADYNMAFKLNGGTLITDDISVAYTSTAKGQAKGVSATVFSEDGSNTNNFAINSGRVINLYDGPSTCIYTYAGRLIPINGGEFYSKGAFVYVRAIEQAVNINVNVNGGKFYALPNSEGYSTEVGTGFFTALSTNEITNPPTGVANININAGEFYNLNEKNKAFASADSDAYNVNLKVNGGTFLSAVKADNMEYIANIYDYATGEVAAATNGSTVNQIIVADKTDTVTIGGIEYYVCYGNKYAAAALDYGKDLTDGTRADALVHGEDDCFDVYNGETLVDTYKTITDAWAAMKPGYTLKLKGNVHATNWAAMAKGETATRVTHFTDAAGKGAYTIDGQGYIFDIEVATAKTATYQYALSFYFNASGNSTLTMQNIAILSDASGIAFNNGTNTNTVNLNNFKLYASDGYYKVDPAYYGADFVYPTVLKGTDEQGYQSSSAMYIEQARWSVQLNGADSVIYGRNAAVRGRNIWFTLNDGLVKTEHSMYDSSDTQSDSAAIFVVGWTNSNITVNGGRVVNTQPTLGGSGIRVQQGQTVNVNGGEFLTTGSAVHVKSTQAPDWNTSSTAEDKTRTYNVTVTVKGGKFVMLPSTSTEAASDNGFFVTNDTTVTANNAANYDKITNKQSTVIFNISGGVYLNLCKSTNMKALVSTTETATKAKINVTGGLWLSAVDASDSLAYLANTYSGADETTEATNVNIVGGTVAVTKDASRTIVYENAEYYVCASPATGTATDLDVKGGAQARLVKDSSGIRFITTITDYDAEAEVTYGTIIVPTEYVLKALALKGGINEANLIAVSKNGKIAKIEATRNKGLVDNGNGTATMYAALVGLEGFEDMAFTAIAYKTVGETTTYTAPDVIDNSRTISAVAKLALADVATTMGGTNEKGKVCNVPCVLNDELGVTVYHVNSTEAQNLLVELMTADDLAACKALIKG